MTGRRIGSHGSIRKETCSSAWMGLGGIPKEIPTYFVPDTCPGFFHIVARRNKIDQQSKQ